MFSQSKGGPGHFVCKKSGWGDSNCPVWKLLQDLIFILTSLLLLIMYGKIIRRSIVNKLVQ